MPADGPVWNLEGFEEWLNIWEGSEETDVELRWVVISWMLTLVEDPYRDAVREPAAANLWVVRVPRTFHDGSIVLCSYWIYESTRTVKCNILSTLSWPT